MEKEKGDRQDKRTENIKERTQAKIEKKLKKKVCMCWVFLLAVGALASVSVLLHPPPAETRNVAYPCAPCP